MYERGWQYHKKGRLCIMEKQSDKNEGCVVVCDGSQARMVDVSLNVSNAEHRGCYKCSGRERCIAGEDRW